MHVSWFVFIPVFLAILTNGLSRKNKNKNRNRYLPPGWVIGIIWIVLFGLLGYASYIVRDNPFLLGFIVSIIMYCLAYPTITNLDSSSEYARILNIGTFILATILILVMYIHQQTYVIIWIIPLWLWATYINGADMVQELLD